ncbi:MAG: UDP-N-acetylmuramoyl-L-alanyl-D-glutamate--2,6-diaminopimelate ligase [Gammaproteobacteria bacterium]
MTTSAMTPSMNLSTLLQSECVVPASMDRELSGVQLDSRRVRPGDLFLAYKGAAVDGRDFIPAAIDSGAAAVLVEADAQWQSARSEGAVPLIPVVDLPDKIGRVAARFYGEPARRMRMIGITGTNGKTTCSQLAAQALAKLGHRCGVIGTLGYGMAGEPLKVDGAGPSTTPDPVRLQQILHEVFAQQGDTVVMEVTSHGLVQKRVDVDDFTAAVFTNLTRDHLDFHGSMAAYGAAKALLFTGTRLQIALVNLDDPFSADILRSLPEHVQAWTWSLRDPAASVHARSITFTSAGLVLDVGTPWGDGIIESQLFGSFNASNLLAVLATVLACEAGTKEFDARRIMRVVGELAPVPGRMEVVGVFPLPVVVDYAHTPDGLENALRALREHFPGRITCVFGCGGERDRGKRPLMAEIAQRLADTVIVTDDNPRNEASSAIIADILAGFGERTRVKVEADRARAIELAIATAPLDGVVLIAGKGHENYQEAGGRKFEFSDLRHAQQCLRQRFAQAPLQ